MEPTFVRSIPSNKVDDTVRTYVNNGAIHIELIYLNNGYWDMKVRYR